MTPLKNRVVMIVGASGSIGAVTARAFAAKGARLVLAALPDAALEAIAREMRSSQATAICQPVDITKRTDIDELVRATLAAFGRIDVAVNASGIGMGPSLLDRSDDELRAVIDINLLGTARLMHAILPVMTVQRSGAFVTIGSVAGEVGILGIYSASKFGVRGLCDSVRREVASANVSVTLIEPGLIRSTMNPADGDRLPGPEVVATAIVNAVARPRRANIVPWTYRLPVSIFRALPALADRVFGDTRIQARLNRDARAKKQMS